MKVDVAAEMRTVFEQLQKAYRRGDLTLPMFQAGRDTLLVLADRIGEACEETSRYYFYVAANVIPECRVFRGAVDTPAES